MIFKKHIMPFVSLLFAVYVASGFSPNSSEASDRTVYSSVEANRTAETPAKSKRIEVYALSQNYWDTKSGDTLSDIVMQLLPNNPSKHIALQHDIVRLNPHAFINSDPERLLADKRLWLPGYMKQADSKTDPTTTTVESYSWGNIKRTKH